MFLDVSVLYVTTFAFLIFREFLKLLKIGIFILDSPGLDYPYEDHASSFMVIIQWFYLPASMKKLHQDLNKNKHGKEVWVCFLHKFVLQKYFP